MKTIYRLINSKLRVATFVLASLCIQNPLVAAEKLVASFDDDESVKS